jgi:hypothetical protein
LPLHHLIDGMFGRLEFPYIRGGEPVGDHQHPLMPGMQDDQIYGRLRDRCCLASSLSLAWERRLSRSYLVRCAG